MKYGKMMVVLAAICGLVLAGSARATDYDDAASANWNVTSTWTSAGGTFPQNPADNALIDSNKVTVPGTYSFPDITQITIGGTGHLFIDNHATEDRTVSADIVFTGGGTLEKSRYETVTVNGAIQVTGGTSTVIAGVDRAMYWNGTVSGPAGVTLVKKGHPIYGGGLHLNAASPNYDGDWQVLEGTLYAGVNGALGTGSIVVDGTSINDPTHPSTIRFDYMPAAGILSGVGPDDITLKTYGNLYFNNDGDGMPGTGPGTNQTMDIDWSNDPVLYMDGGAITGYHGAGPNGIVWHDPIQVVSTGTIAPGYRNFRMLGDLSGAAGTKLTIGSPNCQTMLEAPTSSFLGDMDIPGKVQLKHAFALDNCGTVTVLNGGWFDPQAVPDVTMTRPTVIVKTGGTYGSETPADADWDLILDGGGIYTKHVTITHEGTIQLTSNGGTVQVGYGHFRLDGQITDAAGVVPGTEGALTLKSTPGSGYVFLRHANNTYAGRTVVETGRVYANQAPDLGAGLAGSLGTGPITVKNATTLYLQDTESDPDWALYTCDMTIETGGIVQYVGTDNATVASLTLGSDVIPNGEYEIDEIWGAINFDDYFNGDNDDDTITVGAPSGDPIPEPAGLGLIGAAFLALRKRRRTLLGERRTAMKYGKMMIVFAALCLVAVAGPALADSFNDAVAGKWDAQTVDTWGKGGSPPYDYPGKDGDLTDTAVIDSVTVGAGSAGTGYVIPNIASLEVKDSGILSIGAVQNTGTVQTVDLILSDGGTIKSYGAGNQQYPVTLSGNVTVTGGADAGSASTVNIQPAGYNGISITGNISSTTEFCTLSQSAGRTHMRLGGDNTGFTGEINSNIDIYSAFYTDSAKALGNASKLTVTNGTFSPQAVPDPLLTQPQIVIINGTYGSVVNGPVADADFNLELQNSMFYTRASSFIHSGSLALTGANSVQLIYGDIWFDGQITDAPGVVPGTEGAFTLNSHQYGGEIFLRHPNNTYAGGTVAVKHGVYANQAPDLDAGLKGSLGTGPVTVTNGGTLHLQDTESDPDWALYTCDMTIETGGIVQYVGTDNATVASLTLGITLIDDGMWYIGTDTPNGIDLTTYFTVDDLYMDTITIGAPSAGPIPEPAGLGLLGLGLLALRRRRS